MKRTFGLTPLQKQTSWPSPMLKSASWSSRRHEVIFGIMTDSLKRKIGTWIRNARQRAALSQEALASRVKRTPESISNIERGQQLPSIDTLIALAAVLELPLTDVFDSFSDDRKVSPERARNEAEITDLVRTLSDNAVAIAARQMEALKAVR